MHRPPAKKESSPALENPASKAVFVKIDRRLLPLLLIAYMIAYLDRINIGYAQLQMKQTLPFDDAVYGLGAGIFTSDISHAIRFAREVDSGNLHVNWTPLWRADLMPYGGLKGSGIGREGPRCAAQEMTELKTVVLHGVS